MASLVLSTCRPPSILPCGNNDLPLHKFNHKPLCLTKQFCTITKNRSKKPCSSYIALTGSYKNAPAISIGEEEDGVEEVENQALCDGLRAESMPKHVAMFMDGHRRWAKERDLPAELGYGVSRRSGKDIVRICCELGIKVLSFYMFSSGSFRRPREEVDITMNIIESTMKTDLDELARNDIRLSIFGNRSAIPKTLLEIITQAEKATKNNKTLHVIGAVAYTGRSDILQACVTLAEKVKDGLIQPTDIDESLFQQFLQTNCYEFPYPDLMIRTGGKYCLDNSMLWQMAYSELYFAEKHAPEFKGVDFIQALNAYQERHRRFRGYNY